MLGLQNEREWATFCAEVLRQPALATDERFASNSRRTAARVELRAIIVAAFAALTADAGDRAPRRRADRQRADERHARGLGASAARGARALGRRRDARRARCRALLPPGLPVDPPPRMDAVPALGEHTDAILRELGCGRLRRSRGCAPPARSEHVRARPQSLARRSPASPRAALRRHSRRRSSAAPRTCCSTGSARRSPARARVPSRPSTASPCAMGPAQGPSEVLIVAARDQPAVRRDGQRRRVALRRAGRRAQRLGVPPGGRWCSRRRWRWRRRRAPPAATSSPPPSPATRSASASASSSAARTTRCSTPPARPARSPRPRRRAAC